MDEGTNKCPKGRKELIKGYYSLPLTPAPSRFSEPRVTTTKITTSSVVDQNLFEFKVPKQLPQKPPVRFHRPWLTEPMDCTTKTLTSTDVKEKKKDDDDRSPSKALVPARRDAATQTEPNFILLRKSRRPMKPSLSARLQGRKVVMELTLKLLNDIMQPKTRNNSCWDRHGGLKCDVCYKWFLDNVNLPLLRQLITPNPQPLNAPGQGVINNYFTSDMQRTTALLTQLHARHASSSK